MVSFYIGFIGALTLIAVIGNVQDFDDADELTKWAGLTPTVYQSANVTRTGSITKQGSLHIRWILVELAHIAIRSPGRIKSFFEKLMPKKGYKKAIVTVARKMLRVSGISRFTVNYSLMNSQDPNRSNAQNCQRRFSHLVYRGLSSSLLRQRK